MDGDMIGGALVAAVILVFAVMGAIYVATDATPMFELARTCEQHGFIQNENYRIECSVVWRDK
jgi:hypothetical protein